MYRLYDIGYTVELCEPLVHGAKGCDQTIPALHFHLILGLSLGLIHVESASIHIKKPENYVFNTNIGRLRLCIQH